MIFSQTKRLRSLSQNICQRSSSGHNDRIHAPNHEREIDFHGMIKDMAFPRRRTYSALLGRQDDRHTAPKAVGCIQT